MKRFLWLGFVLCLYLICSGCGDTFRPIIIPNPPTFPNPKAAHTVVAINDNGLFVPGSAMVIDVSGDTDVSHANLDIAPVHAVQQTANEVLVVNQAVTGLTVQNVPTTSCLVTFPPTPPNHVFNVCSSITKLNFSGTVIGGTNAISLPIYSGANFVAVAPTDTTAYVTLPTYPPDPTQPLNIVPSVGVVNTQSNNLVATIPVGKNPVALAVTPDKNKLYVANKDSNSISGFNTVDRSQRVDSPASTTSPPIWLSVRTDGQRVYALEQNGTLAWLDTTSTAGPDILSESTTINVPGATTMVYDGNLNRLYIPGGSEMEIIDISQSQPQPIATIPIPSFALLPVGSSAPATAAAAAALPDGSRAYVASYAVLQSQFNISSVTGDGTTATYAYTLTAGHDLTQGVSITVTGTGTGFDGTFIVGAILSGTTACPGTCFQAHNTMSGKGTAGSGTGSNIFPQVTVVDAMSNTIKTTASVPGFPDATVMGSPYYAPICATTRFRFTMAAGGDSSRAYLASCDGGMVNIIDTTSDTYILNIPAPIGVRPGGQQNLPQNPVFLFAGP